MSKTVETALVIIHMRKKYICEFAIFPVSFNIGVCLPYYMRFEAIIIIYDNITAKGWFFAFGLCKTLSGQDRIYFRFPTNPVGLFYL